MLGKLFRVSLFGESHGKYVGVLVEGAPPGIPLTEQDIAQELARRKPGVQYTSPRREEDIPEILTGVYRGYTTGAPIVIIVSNRDIDSSWYEKVVRFKPRPGHADFTERLRSIGFRDYRGGGYQSGRITVGIVAAGVIAKKILEEHGIRVLSYLRYLGEIECRVEANKLEELVTEYIQTRIPCPDDTSRKEMEKLLEELVRVGDSVGGIIETWIYNLPPGLGEPHYDSLDGDIAKAIFMIPGVKGIEFGKGFRLAHMRGSKASDTISISQDGTITIKPGYSGGILGGISTGSPINFRVAVKPTSTIRFPQRTIDWRTLEETEIIGEGRHDPSIAIRAVPVVEATTSIVLADHLMRYFSWRLEQYYRLESS